MSRKAEALCPRCKGSNLYINEKRICYSDDSNGDPFMVAERWIEFECLSCNKKWSVDK